MSFKDTQSYKELQADWRWIHEMDPEAAAAADQWVKEHPEEWKELEHKVSVAILMFNCCLKISICCTPGAFNEQHLITSRLQYLVGSVSNIRFCIVFIFQFV